MGIDSVKHATMAHVENVHQPVTMPVHTANVSQKVIATGKTGAGQENFQKGNQGDNTVAVEQKEGNDKFLKSVVDQANHKFKQNRTRCEFMYHEQTKQVSIKIIDDATKEVIREIPSEDSIRMVEKMWELAGILVDEKR